MTYKTKESQEQITALNWFRLQYPHIEEGSFHIANERKCSPQYGRYLKQMGVKSGISDLCIPFPNDKYHGLWIEAKTKEGRLTPAQDWFINLMNSRGYYATVAHGAEEIISVIKWYAKL